MAWRSNWTGPPILWGVGRIGPPPITDALATEKFHAVALGRDDAVLTRLDGTLVGIGKNVPVRSVPAGSYHAVAVAAVHAVAIAHDGALTTWGSDSTTLPTGDVVTGLRRQPSTSWRSRLVPDRSRLSGIWRRGWYWTDARDASENA